jgi:hypothetical protein
MVATVSQLLDRSAWDVSGEFPLYQIRPKLKPPAHDRAYNALARDHPEGRYPGFTVNHDPINQGYLSITVHDRDDVPPDFDPSW